jgi:hypothetical protein
MKQISRLVPGSPRPQVGGQSPFQLGNGLQVRPGAAFQDAEQGRVMQAAFLSGRPDAPLANRPTQIDDEQPRYLTDRTRRWGAGPGVGERRGSRTLRTGHEPSVDERTGAQG